MKKNYISPAVIRRLPRYYRRLDELHLAGVERISSSALGESLRLTASQIRQDFSCFGEFGQQGYGYRVDTLRAEISQILGVNKGRTAIVVGAGNLGRALIENFPFDRTGFHLLAAFDVDPSLVGTEIAETPILSTSQLDGFLRQTPVDVGVLTVPRSMAAETAHQLVELGVKGIWNFTNVELPLADAAVIVENVHFADSLLALGYMISKE